MAKVTNYFSHDSNARNDEKILALRMRLGAEGYGIYFMVLERLREESGYSSVKDYNIIAFDLRVNANTVKSVVEDFGLFTFTDDGKRFYSESFTQRMEIKDEKKKIFSEAGKKGGGNPNFKKGNPNPYINNDKPPLSENPDTLINPFIGGDKQESKERKESKQTKETTLKDHVQNEILNDSDFEHFWSLYDKKVKQDKCVSLWQRLKHDEKILIFNNLPKYIASTPDKQFRKDPETYLRNKSWNDEIIWRENAKNKSIFETDEFRRKASEIAESIASDPRLV